MSGVRGRGQRSDHDRDASQLMTTQERTWRPITDDEVEVVRLGIECSPCFDRTCRFGHYNCMRLLEPGAVIQALGRLDSTPVEVI